MVKKASHGTPATLALARAGITVTEHAYTHHEDAQSYGGEAAGALGLPETLVYKTLLVTHDRALAVAVVPVSGQLDLKAVASALGWKKAAMADPAVAERSTGMVVGGISPVGQRTRLPTVLDTSALAHETIYVSGGRRGLSLGISPADLVAVTDAQVAPIGR